MEPEKDIFEQWEEDMVKQYGKDNVWICDNLQEILVG